MKKRKLSFTENKTVRAIFLFILIQTLIVFSFILLVKSSQQIDINDTRQVDITIDDIYIIRVPKEDWLFVVADSTYYLFTSRASLEEYSVHELYNSISKGDHLSLIYYELDSILFKKVNTIIDARTETEIYRTIEEYNRGKQGVPIFIVILYSIIELMFVGGLLIYAWINLDIIKSIYRKTKKDRKTIRGR